MKLPLIAPKPFADYTEIEWHSYVQSMYALRVRGSKTKPASPVPGLSVTRNAKGALAIRRTSRAFAYVTFAELEVFAKALSMNQSELWQLFKQKQYLVTKTRMQAEQAYAEQRGKHGEESVRSKRKSRSVEAVSNVQDARSDGESSSGSTT